MGRETQPGVQLAIQVLGQLQLGANLQGIEMVAPMRETNPLFLKIGRVRGLDDGLSAVSQQRYCPGRRDNEFQEHASIFLAL